MKRNIQRKKRGQDQSNNPPKIPITSHPYIICAFLSAITFAVYWQIHNFEFIDIDDILYVTMNPNVNTGFNVENFRWAFTTFHATNWHPLAWLSHMLDCQFYGLDSGRHHLTNLFLHTASVVLLFLLLRRMTGEIWTSVFVSSLFAVHPLNAESIAWVAERKNVLSTLFWILTMRAYIHYTDKPGLARYFLVTAALAMGLMAKPMLVTLPLVLLLIDYWPLKRSISFRRALVEKIPLFGLSLISSYITVIAQRSGGAMASLEMLPLSLRIANALMSYTRYIEMMVWPSGLSFFYPIVDDLALWKVMVSGAVLLCISILCVLSVKRHPYFLVGWLWYVITLIPVIGIVQVGRQSMADRYTYVPLIGLYIFISWGIASIVEKWQISRKGLAVSVGIVFSMLGIASYKTVGAWKNNITLYEAALRNTNGNYLAHYNLANLLFNSTLALFTTQVQ